MDASGVSRSYRPDIDGLRAVAVSLVVLYHAKLMGLTGGFVGVDVFFVISGYLISGHIYSDVLVGRFSFEKFYAKRVRRILPAFFAVLIFCFLAGFLLLNPLEFNSFSKSALSALIGASNIYYWLSANYFATSSENLPLLMTWSLGVEEQFYVFFPCVLLLVHRFWPRRVLLAVIGLSVLSLIYAAVRLSMDPLAAFFLIPSRIWELGAGAILAISQIRGLPTSFFNRTAREVLGCLGLAAIVVPAFLYDEATPFPALGALPPVVGTFVLIAMPNTLVGRLLSTRPFTAIGLVSYSWYLWHWPLLSFANISTPIDIPTLSLCLIVLLSLALATVTYFLVEKPFRRPRVSNRRTVLTYVVALAVVMTPFAVVGKFAERFVPSSEKMASLEKMKAKRSLCLRPYGKHDLQTSSYCVPANADGQPAMAIIGDSHAESFSLGLKQLAKRQGFPLYILTKSSCPPLQIATQQNRRYPKHAMECHDYNQQVLNFLKAHDDIKVVVVTAFWSLPIAAMTGEGAAAVGERGGPVLEKALRDQVDKLEESGKRVVLVKDVPVFDFDPLNIFAVENDPERKWVSGVLAEGGEVTGDKGIPLSHLRNRTTGDRRIIEDMGQTSKVAATLDPFGPFCDDETCRISDETQLPFYLDSQHLSEVGARKVVDAFAPRILTVFRSVLASGADF